MIRGEGTDKVRALFASRCKDSAAVRMTVYECMSCLAGLIAQYRWQRRNVHRRMSSILDSIDVYGEDVDLVSAREWAQEMWIDWLEVLRLLVGPTFDLLKKPSIWMASNQLAQRLLHDKCVPGPEANALFTQANPSQISRASLIPAESLDFWQRPDILAVTRIPTRAV